LRIERYQSRGKRGMSGCGCGLIGVGMVVIIAVAFMMIAPAIPSIGLRLAGFEAIDSNTIQTTPESVPVIQNAQTTTTTTISAGGLGSRSLPASSAYRIQTGTADDGATVAQVTLSETGIMTLCNQYTDVCSTTASAFRNVTVDLGTGTAVIAGEAYISNLNTWQPISAIISLTPDNRIQVEGVNINGTLFAIPDNEIGQRIRDIQSTANQALAQLSIQTDRNTYQLSDIIVTESQLVAIFR